MKAKKIVAIVMGAAIAGTVAVGMSACSGSKKPESLKEGTLAIADYATKYESNYSVKGYTGVENVYTLDYSTVEASLYQGYVVVKESGDKYSVLNSLTGKKILTGLASIPQAARLGYSLNVIKVTYEAADPAERDEVEFYTYDGTKILAKAVYSSYSNVSTLTRYVGNDTKTSRVYQIETSKLVKEELEDVEVFVKINEDEETGEVTYSVVNKADLKTYAPEYNKGSDQSGIKKSVYAASENRPVDGDIKNYEYSYIGNKFTFYKDGTETGIVDLTNGEPLAFMDNGFYYTVSIPVSPEATKGYNMAAIGSKVDYSLYKYDIVANTTTELEYDVIVTDMDVLYNYETKAYDAAVISGIKISDDGVAYGADAFSYVINKDFELCYDVTGMINQAPGAIYDLGGDNYLIDNAIVNSELKVQSYVNGTVYANEGLVLISNYVNGSGYTYGFADYTGKVVIAPEYTAQSGRPVFYGGVTVVMNGDGEPVLLKKDGTEIKIEDLTESNNEKVTKEIVDDGDGFYAIKTTTAVDEGDDKVEVTYYTFDGAVLKTFNHDDIDSIEAADGGVLLAEQTTDTEGNITYSVYKLV